MSHIIRVLEHSTLPVGHRQGTAEFRPEHWQRLRRYHETGAGRRYYDVRPDGIRFKHYVGVVQAGDLTIEVLPKADAVPGAVTSPDEPFDRWRRLLLRMLAEAGLLPRHVLDTALLAEQENNLLDLYLALLLDEVETLLRRGLVKRYRQREGQVKALKGSLLFGPHLARNVVHQERFYTRHQTYDHDHPAQRLLRQALVLLPTLTAHATLRGRAARALLAWPELPLVRATAAVFARLRRGRKLAPYRPALRIARLLLLRLSPDLNSGPEDLIALFFNMNHVWESYLLHTLRRLAPAGWAVSKPPKCVFWQAAGPNGFQSRMQPDVLLHHATHGHVVLDAKWKRPEGGPAEADLRQLFAYAQYYHAARARLLYPQAGHAQAMEGEFTTPGFDPHTRQQRPIRGGVSYLRVGGEAGLADTGPDGYLACSLLQETWLFRP